MIKTLQMIFRNEENRNVTLSVSDPLEGLDGLTAGNAMQDILNANIFQTNGGDMVSRVRAQIVSRDVETLTEF